jgi:hypothetical protein
MVFLLRERHSPLPLRMRKTGVSNDLLEVHRDGPYTIFSCGMNPHFMAEIVDADGKIQRPRLP